MNTPPALSREQRRRRVFVVASARNDFDPCAVLFESDSLRRDTAPSREARQVAPTIPSRGTAGGGLGTDFDCDGGVITMAHVETVPTLRAGAPNGGAGHGARSGDTKDEYIVPVAFHPTQDPISSTDGTTHALGCGSSGGQASVAVAIQDVRGTDKSQNGRGWNDDGTAYTLDTHATQGVAYTDSPMVLQQRHYSGRERMGGEPSKVCHTLDCAQGVAVAQPVAMRESGQGYWMEDSIAGKLRAEGEDRPSRPSHVIGMPPTMAVRRLTPTECERLQGFPDGYTAIPWRNKPASECPDGPRYKALGNSWAVPVAAWIAQRIHRQIAT